ncbi:DUF6705 family protein [Chryseobacterium tongliaoense]|uniref:DUF6705 family protein n=1 Tax=Chryseobacterium tongliaoense TaxID=3240933 RepID=UPI003510E229
MKSIILFVVFFVSFSCKAQVIGTLEQFEECQKRPNRDEVGCPDLENITYVKDTNNRLNQFVGTWKGSANGKQYEIKLEKKTNYKDDPSDERTWDMIIGRMLIKNSSGNIIYTSMNKPDKDTYFFGYNFQSRAYVMSFIANSYCIDRGEVFIEISKTNPNTMFFHFSRDIGHYDPAKCPNFTTYVPVLPKEKITLTKQ